MTEPTQSGNAADRDLAVLAAAACAGSGRLQSAANAALLAVFATSILAWGTVPDFNGTPARATALLGIAALAVWAWQTVLAARLALDARVFDAFTRGPDERLQPAGFDQALTRAGLRAAAAPRGMEERWRGAKRLLVQQMQCVGALALMAMFPLVWIGANA